MISRDSANSLIMLLVALGGLVFGLVPQLLLYVSLNFIGNLFVLLLSAYAVFFISLAVIPLGAALIVKKSGAQLPLPGLRVALIIEAAGLSALWYSFINPFPLKPLLENQQYMAALPPVLVVIFGWIFFLFIMKKIF